MRPILAVRNLSTGYGKRQVLFNVNLDVMPGDLLLVQGGNGSGKSSLLKAIFGLLPPWNSDGEILYYPDPIAPPHTTRHPVRNIYEGLVYLQQKNGVFEGLTGEDNLRLAAHVLPQSLYTIRRDNVLASLPALKTLLPRKPEMMSGGQRQILALGMVLLHRPKLLLLDEPLSGLDSERAQEIVFAVEKFRELDRSATIIVEHRSLQLNIPNARKLQLQLGVLRADSLQGKPLYESPSAEYLL